jgi:hypothetical protein
MEQPAASVVIDERCRRLVEDLESLTDDVRRVSGAPFDLRPRQDALNELVTRRVQVDDGVGADPFLLGQPPGPRTRLAYVRRAGRCTRPPRIFAAA